MRTVLCHTSKLQYFKAAVANKPDISIKLLRIIAATLSNTATKGATWGISNTIRKKEPDMFHFNSS